MSVGLTGANTIFWWKRPKDVVKLYGFYELMRHYDNLLRIYLQHCCIVELVGRDARKNNIGRTHKQSMRSGIEF